MRGAGCQSYRKVSTLRGVNLRTRTSRLSIILPGHNMLESPQPLKVSGKRAWLKRKDIENSWMNMNAWLNPLPAKQLTMKTRRWFMNSNKKGIAPDRRVTSEIRWKLSAFTRRDRYIKDWSWKQKSQRWKIHRLRFPVGTPTSLRWNAGKNLRMIVTSLIQQRR